MTRVRVLSAPPPRPADKQHAARQNARQRQTERQQKCATTDQQGGKEIEQQAHGYQAEPKTQTQAVQQRAYATPPLQAVEAAGSHQPEHHKGESQRLRQQRGEIFGDSAGVEKARADACVDGATEYQSLDHHQQQ